MCANPFRFIIFKGACSALKHHIHIEAVKMPPSLPKAALGLSKSRPSPHPPFTSSFQCLKYPNQQRTLASVAQVSYRASAPSRRRSSGAGYNQQIHVTKKPYSSSHSKTWSVTFSPRKATITTEHEKSWIWKKTYTYKTVQEARSRYRIGVRRPSPS